LRLRRKKLEATWETKFKNQPYFALTLQDALSGRVECFPADHRDKPLQLARLVARRTRDARS
jgi:hypothetical protein